MIEHSKLISVGIRVSYTATKMVSKNKNHGFLKTSYKMIFNSIFREK
jgi:hypothetical protein